MSCKKCHLAFVFGAMAITTALLTAGPVGAENATTIDLSTQPHLKAWSNIIPNAAKRFVTLADFNNQAVLDRETGLVWERSPETNPRIWEDAVRTCWLRQVGGRMGWHLPMIEELASLVDPSIAAPGPALPLGHPFQNVQSGDLFESAYWSATTDVRAPLLPTQAWEVRFFDGTTGDSGKSGTRHLWCVRGGTHADKY